MIIKETAILQIIELFVKIAIFFLRIKKMPKLSSITLTSEKSWIKSIKAKQEVLTLNNDETFDVLPNSNYLCSHNENFLGTILECKLYLNKDFLNNNEEY